MKRELRLRCVRLRREGRKSLREIHEITGASKGSLSVWLKPYPLSGRERKERQLRSYRRRGPRESSRFGGPSNAYELMVKGQVTTDAKGTAAELLVRARLALAGFEVYSPAVDKTAIDLLVRSRKTGRLSKVQVRKTYASKHGCPLISLRKSNGRSAQRKYVHGEADCIIGYDFFSDTAFVFSWDEIKNKRVSVSATAEAAERWDKLD